MNTLSSMTARFMTPKTKFVATFCVTMIMFSAVRHIFDISVPVRIGQQAEVVPIPAPTQQADAKGGVATQRRYNKIRGVHSWEECFPDINDVQLEAAQKNGIAPARDKEEILRLAGQRKLVNISHSPYYTIDNLTHSMPYLVPKAQHLLNTICINFVDSLQSKGLPLHLPIVTSVLRTTDDVSRLQRGNVNATTNSCHCYGTTVDITYNRFTPLIGRYDPNVPLLCWDMPMKQVLAEVLYDLRRRGLCYVKYEKKQACFHLTVR